METLLSEIKKYFKNTNSESIKTEWEKVEKMNLNGPNAFEYLKTLNNESRTTSK
jgi:hypothetical protein